MRLRSFLAAAAFAALVITFPAPAQINRGSISGLVVDSSGAAVPNAAVSITETETKVRTSTVAGPDGLFLFAGVLPGNYTLKVEVAGFRVLVKTNLNLSAGERLAIGQLRLEVGAETQSVTVTTQGAPVQADSSDRGDLVTTKDVERLPMAGRNWASLLNVLPGAISQTNSLEPDTGNANMPIYNGVSNAFTAIYEDGVTNNQMRSYQYGAGETPDVIAELKVETGNYNAEYGGAGGANVQVISKSGTSHFHGDLFFFVRNEFWEANDFFNNMTGSPKQVDRFIDYGGTLGGPIFWPGKFNRDKNKLFFFIGQEYVPANGPNGGLSTLTMPTALQRKGDFSQTTTPAGALIPVNDPTTHTPFPGNVVPASLINPGGQALLNVFPLPNFINPAVSRNQYNYVYQPYLSSYNHYHFYRFDWDPSDKLRLFWRLDYDPVNDTTLLGTNWPMLTTSNNFPYIVTAFDASYIFSPTIVNDFTFGLTERRQHDVPDTAAQFAALNRETNGVNIPQFHAENNPNHLIPQATFGGGEIPRAPSIKFGSVIPFSAWAPAFTGSDSLTVVRGTHTLKGGIYFNRSRYVTDAGSFPYQGSFDFSNNINNPFDASYPYANTIVGSYNSYQESTTRPVQDIRGLDFEWYLQDTWKATRRLTLNYGIRLAYFTPWHSANRLGVNFLPSAYNPAQAVSLYQPVISQGQRLAQDPFTSEVLPAGFVGAIVPGHGNPNNGLVSANASGVPEGFINNYGVLLGPRFGFAYMLTNDEKTVLRGGFGVAYSGHDNQSLIAGTVNNTSQTASAYSGTFNSLTSAATAVFPTSINAINPTTKAPAVYTYSLGLQRDVGLGTRVGAAYVGSLTRHLDQPQTAFDAVPFGAEFLPQNQDPTSPGKPLPDNYYRPYMGYSGLTLQQFVNSNYNSLQVDVVHRFSQNLELNVNYTWSKNMGYYSPFATYYNNALQYGALPYDRTNILRIYYVYNLPKVSKHWNVRPVRWVLDNWQVSGITQFESGYPQSINCQFTYSVNLFGGGDYSRCILTGPLALAKSQRTFGRFFNPAVIQPPTATNPGNAAPDAFRGPGVNDWDITVFKNFPIGEHKSVEFRVETYNTFNHPQFNTVDTTAQFNNAGRQVNDTLGQITGDYLPRQIQFALKVIF